MRESESESYLNFAGAHTLAPLFSPCLRAFVLFSFGDLKKNSRKEKRRKYLTAFLTCSSTSLVSL